MKIKILIASVLIAFIAVFTVLLMNKTTSSNMQFKLLDEISFQEDFEPSGVSVCDNKIYIISDEGTFSIYDMNTHNKEYFTISKEKDFEGITCNGKDLYVAEEGEDNILKISKKGKILETFDISRKYKGKKVISKKGDGLESLAFYKEDSKFIYFFTSNQSDEFSGKDRSSIMVIKVNKKNNKSFIDEYFPMNIPDISGIFYKYNILYFISDDKDTIYLSDTNLNIIKKYAIPGKAQEGIFIQDKMMFIADDEGYLMVLELFNDLI